MTVGFVTLAIAVILYLGAAAAYVAGTSGTFRSPSRYGRVLASVGLGVHGIGLVIIGIGQNRFPFATLRESLILASWAVMFLYLITARKRRIEAIGAFAGIVAACMVGAGLVLPKTVSPLLMKFMDSPWSAIHIIASLTSYSAFILSAGAALAYIIQEHMLKNKRINAFQRHLPSLDVLDHTAYSMATFGFVMLTLGIITGSLWASTAWGSYWSWDGKETWSLVTWLVYAAYLHTRMLRGLQGKWSNRLLLAGFVCVIVTYLGVTYIAPSLHNYKI